MMCTVGYAYTYVYAVWEKVETNPDGIYILMSQVNFVLACLLSMTNIDLLKYLIKRYLLPNYKTIAKIKF